MLQPFSDWCTKLVYQYDVGRRDHVTTVFVMTPTEFQRMRIQRSSKQELRRHKKGRLREMLNSPVTCFNCANKRRTRALIESAL
jgi:hypothetical protein